MDKTEGHMQLFKLDVKELLSFFMPVFIEQFCISVCGVIVSTIIARLGSAEVSGYNLVGLLNVFLYQVFIAMGTGAAVLVSQYRGKNDALGAGRVAVQSIWFLTGFSVIVMTAIFAANRPILNALLGAADPAVYENGRIHLMTASWSIPVYMLYYVCAQIVCSSGNPKKSMILNIITNCLYALFSWIFIMIGFGMYGPGLALMVSRLYGAIHGLIMVKKGNQYMFVSTMKIKKLEFKILKVLLFVGIPMSVENIMFQGGRLLTQTFIVPLGTYPLAANGIANSMSNLLIVPGNSIGLSLVPVVGRFIGMEDEKRARSVTRVGLILSTAMHIITSLLCFVLMDQYIGLYKQPEAVNVIIRSIMYEYIIMMPILWATAIALPYALRAAGDVKFNMAVAIASMLLLRVLLSYILIKFTDIGVRSIWIGMYADWLARAVLFYARFKSKAWTKKRLI